MNIQERIASLVYLGKQIGLKHQQLVDVQEFVQHKNNWFTKENTDFAFEQIFSNFLQKEKLENLVQQYKIADPASPQNVAILMAGNPPLAGFHDLLMVFLSGHFAKIKLATDDNFLIPQLIKILVNGFPEAEKYFSFVERFNDFQAVIVGSNRESTQTYATYFSKFPNVIRTYKTGIGILTGKETKDDLANFTKDIFLYFGLSPRSVSKIFIPKNYDFVPLLEATHEWNRLVLNNKYKNNFDYNYTLHILNKVDYKANGCIMIIEDQALISRIATLHYEEYKDAQHLQKLLERDKEGIQHIIQNSNGELDFKIPSNLISKGFGQAHELNLTEFENGIDVLDFLKKIN